MKSIIPVLLLFFYLQGFSNGVDSILIQTSQEVHLSEDKTIPASRNQMDLLGLDVSPKLISPLAFNAFQVNDSVCVDQSFEAYLALEHIIEELKQQISSLLKYNKFQLDNGHPEKCIYLIDFKPGVKVDYMVNSSPYLINAIPGNAFFPEGDDVSTLLQSFNNPNGTNPADIVTLYAIHVTFPRKIINTNLSDELVEQTNTALQTLADNTYITVLEQRFSDQVLLVNLAIKDHFNWPTFPSENICMLACYEVEVTKMDHHKLMAYRRLITGDILNNKKTCIDIRINQNASTRQTLAAWDDHVLRKKVYNAIYSITEVFDPVNAAECGEILDLWNKLYTKAHDDIDVKFNGTKAFIELTPEEINNLKSILTSQVSLLEQIFGADGVNPINWQKILTFLYECKASYASQKNGIFPRCLWKDTGALPYIPFPTITGAGTNSPGVLHPPDLAVIAGLIDGMWSLVEFSDGIAEFIGCVVEGNAAEIFNFELSNACEKSFASVAKFGGFIKDMYDNNENVTTHLTIRQEMLNTVSYVFNPFHELNGAPPPPNLASFWDTSDDSRYLQGKVAFEMLQAYFNGGSSSLKTAATSLKSLAEITKNVAKTLMKSTATFAQKIRPLISAAGMMIVLKIAATNLQKPIMEISDLSTGLAKAEFLFEPNVLKITDDAFILATKNEAVKDAILAQVHIETGLFQASAGSSTSAAKLASCGEKIAEMGVKSADDVPKGISKVADDASAGVDNGIPVVYEINHNGTDYLVAGYIQDVTNVLKPVMIYAAATGDVVGSAIDKDADTQDGNSTNKCKSCRDYNQVLCKEVEKIKKINENAGKKLCGANITDASLLPICMDILDLPVNPINKRNSFLSNLAGPIPSSQTLKAQHIGHKDNVDQLSQDVISDWKFVKDAICDVSTSNTCITTKFPMDFVLLQKVRSLRQNTVVLPILGNEAGLKLIIGKHILAKCYTCQNTNPPEAFYMHSYLEDVEYFASNYMNPPVNGASDMIDGSMGIKANNMWHVYANAFVLRVLREYAIPAASLSAFEEKYNEEDETVQRIVDIKELSGKLIECKSWVVGKADSALDKFSSPPKASNSRGQFRDYFKQGGGMQKMEDLEYWFDKNRDGLLGLGAVAAQNKIKPYFQKLLCANCQAPNQGNPPSVPYTLTSFGTEVFEAIWGNVLLRGNLFPGLDYTIPIAETKASAEARFIAQVKDIQSDFYSFIKVK